MNVHELFLNRKEFSFSLKQNTQTYFKLSNQGGSLIKINGSRLAAAGGRLSNGATDGTNVYLCSFSDSWQAKRLRA